MIMQSPISPMGSGEIFLTEGGSETEIMYRHGFELPEFAMFPLLEDARAVSAMRGIFSQQLDVAAEYGLSFLLTGLDYRASPDWGKKLGYSASALAEANLASIEFLRDIAKGYEDQVPNLLIGGILGPRGDAYNLNREITADSAEDYHAVQLETLKSANVDFACAMTFNNVAESVGAARAAARIGVPLSVSLTLDSTFRLKSGPSLPDAITEIDALTADHAPDFYLLNCSHPIEYEPALEDGDWIRRLRGVRPNASRMEKIALCKLGHIEDGDPVELGSQVLDLASRYPHMDIFGGCCGTGHSHLREIARALKQSRSGK
ncbi:homocysteine S-methyltransferase family protein [Anderseniella sp. Alg231-50]|uniref:homocysteine S-methyltransferase family protein n=1 Tax=Anderseniella sp. Alg231-50 TaxID=1922226 RepID=UPI00307C862E